MFVLSRDAYSSSRGAKVALTLCLHAPDVVSAVVAVDNCPVHNVPLPEDFPRYLRGLECVEQAKIRTHAEGERILAEFEEVCLSVILLLVCWNNTLTVVVSHSTVVSLEQFRQMRRLALLEITPLSWNAENRHWASQRLPISRRISEVQ